MTSRREKITQASPHRQPLTDSALLGQNICLITGLFQRVKPGAFGKNSLELHFETCDPMSRQAYEARDPEALKAGAPMPSIYSKVQIVDSAPMLAIADLVPGEPFHMLGHLQFATRRAGFKTYDYMTIRVTQIIKATDTTDLARKIGITPHGHNYAEIQDLVQRRIRENVRSAHPEPVKPTETPENA